MLDFVTFRVFNIIHNHKAWKHSSCIQNNKFFRPIRTRTHHRIESTFSSFHEPDPSSTTPSHPSRNHSTNNNHFPTSNLIIHTTFLRNFPMCTSTFPITLTRSSGKPHNFPYNKSSRIHRYLKNK